VRRWLAILVVAVVVIAAIGVGIGFGLPRLMPPVAGGGVERVRTQDFQLIERGRYLTAAADCAACHTIPGDGRSFAGGRPIETPFGNVVSANITPDPDTGIGGWTDAQFDAAVRQGKLPDGSLLYPAMPYPYYAKMSRDDVLAIRAYLDTIAPVRNVVVADQLPFPFDIRAGMLAWNTLYFNPAEFRPDASKSAEWNRGAYLVEGPGHCGACHTPKNVLGGDELSRQLQGYSIQGWFAPDVTNDDRLGLGQWSIEDIVAYLKTGHNRVTAATGPMGEEVSLASSQMTDADLRAIAIYLKDQVGHGGGNATPPAGTDPVIAAGAAIYTDVCSACHAKSGRGVPNLFPALAGSSNVRSADPTSLLRIILRGARSVATAGEPTGPGMPAFRWQLDDRQIAAVVSYIRNSWGASAPRVSADDVRKTRVELASRNE
jgi:mono/diheme cytochrome c family protein